MARTLLVALQADQHLRIEIYKCAELEYDDESYAFKDPDSMMPATLSEMTKMYASVSRRINGRCKGLLERSNDRMQFLHRTVYDFLRTPDMAMYLRDLAKPCFCPKYSLFQASVAWINRTKFNYSSSTDFKMAAVSALELHNFKQRIRQILQYAKASHKASKRSAALTAALLDHMETRIEAMTENGHIRLGEHSAMVHNYRQLVLEAGISGYTSGESTASSYTTDAQAATSAQPKPKTSLKRKSRSHVPKVRQRKAARKS